MKHLYFLLSLCCMVSVATATTTATTATLHGTVKDAVDGQPIVGASVYFPALKQGTVTDEHGVYRFASLPAVTTTIQVSYVGHLTIIESVNLHTEQERHFVMQENNAMLGEVVVTGLTGTSLADRLPSPVMVVSPQELRQTAATNIIDAVAHQPGVSQLTTGSGISKPVIRGLGYNRIVVVNDGIRQEGQQWGDEHGIEVDAQAVHSVEILKGPASLMYGSDALAGVIVMHEEPVMPLGTMAANVGGEYQTNASLYAYTADFAGNQGGTVWNWRWSEKDAGEYGNRYDHKVYGSQFHERALTGMTGINRTWGYSHLKLSLYHLKPGLVEGERDDATGQLTEAGAYQQIRHYKAALDNSFLVGDGAVKVVVGYQQNRRQEYEEEEGDEEQAADGDSADEEPGLDFRLHTVSYDAHYVSPAGRQVTYAAGVQGMWQRSENLGDEYLIPAYRLFDIGAFASATYAPTAPLTVSGGLRADWRSLHSYALEDDGEQCFADFSRHFSGLTGSLGAIWKLSGRTNLRLNVSRGFRAPNLSELGSNGQHEGTFRYEVGNAGLKPEYSWQADLGLDFSSALVSTQVALFANHIDNYIFLERVVDDRYQFRQGDARLWGGELTVDVHPVEQLHFANTFSYVNAVQLHQPAGARYLPFTPAPRWTTDLRYDIVRDGRQWLNNTFASVGMECYMKQSHVRTVNDTETATPGYVLLSASAGTDIRYRQRRLCSLCLTCSNLADRAYQSHLSRLKYAGENEVTGRKGIYNMGRNVTVKLVVPIGL